MRTREPLRAGGCFARLLSELPELGRRLGELPPEVLAAAGPGLYCEELAGYVSELCRQSPLPHAEISRCFDLVEEMLAEAEAEGPEATSEIGASFLGNLPVTAITTALLTMGERTLSVLEELEEGAAW